MSKLPPDGSYSIDDTWRYGQDIDEQDVMDLLVPRFGISDVKDQLSNALNVLPEDTIDRMQPFLGGTTPFLSKEDGIFQVLASLKNRGHFMDRVEFDEWLRTVFQVLADRQDERQQAWQEFLDGVKSIFEPGATNTPVADALKYILTIRERADAAQESADRANADLAALKAEQAGGWSDRFDYPAATHLDTTKYQEYRTGNPNISWGPNGNGVLTYRPNSLIVGVNPGDVMYREKAIPITGATGWLFLQLKKPPKALSQAAAFMCWHMDTTGACNRVEIKYNQLQLQTVSSSGVVTNVGSPVAIPTVHEGASFEVQWTATNVKLVRNKTITDFDVPYTPAAGTFVGFGGHVPLYTGVGTLLYPCPDFDFIAAHP